MINDNRIDGWQVWVIIAQSHCRMYNLEEFKGTSKKSFELNL